MSACRNKANHLIVTKNNVPWYLCSHHFSLYMTEKTAQYHAAQHRVQADGLTPSAHEHWFTPDKRGVMRCVVCNARR